MNDNLAADYQELLNSYRDLAEGVRMIRRAAERAFRAGVLPAIGEVDKTPLQECDAIARAIYRAAVGPNRDVSADSLVGLIADDPSRWSGNARRLSPPWSAGGGEDKVWHMAGPNQRNEQVNLTVVTEVEIERGVILPLGTYVGTSKQFGFARTDGISWTSPEYTLRLTADQLISMGMKYVRNLSIEFEVTKFAGSGDIVVDSPCA
jgi:hypothetical protein